MLAELNVELPKESVETKATHLFDLGVGILRQNEGLRDTLALNFMTFCEEADGQKSEVSFNHQGKLFVVAIENSILGKSLYIRSSRDSGMESIEVHVGYNAAEGDNGKPARGVIESAYFVYRAKSGSSGMPIFQIVNSIEAEARVADFLRGLEN